MVVVFLLQEAHRRLLLLSVVEVEELEEGPEEEE
jgi:hypothetical protein